MDKDTAFIEKDLKRNDWIGVVINNEDPTYSGRAQVRVFSVYDGIKDEHLPWASPINSCTFGGNGNGNLSVPKKGHFVRIQFAGGDIYSPEIVSIQNIDNQLIEQIKEDYLGTHVLLFDPDQNLSVIFQPGSGLLMFYNESYINITPDSMITLSTENGDSIVQMEGDKTTIATKNEVYIAAASKTEVVADEVVVNGSNTTKIGPGPYKQALLAEPMWGLLTQMATVIDLAKLPVSGGTMVSQVQSAKLAATSTNVKISI